MSTERTTAKRKYKKLPNRSYRAEEYNNKLKNTLQGYISRLVEAEEWISEMEDKTIELTWTEKQKQKRILEK